MEETKGKMVKEKKEVNQEKNGKTKWRKEGKR